MPDLTGQSIGRYRLVSLLGEGGMASVYKAFDTNLECDVAIKIISNDNVPASQWQHRILRFEREARQMAKFIHPNIVRVIDYGKYEDSFFYVMPFLPGNSLSHWLKDRNSQPVPYQMAAHILLPVACALEYIHHQNIIHCNVNDTNILLTDDCLPMLTDFGEAKNLGLEEGNSLAMPGYGTGDTNYMEYEQGMPQISPQTDIYALGIVFYELLTGHPPFDASTPDAVMQKQKTESLPSPKHLVPDLADEVEQVIFSSLAIEPENRYADMGGFARDLEELAYIPPLSLLHIGKEEDTVVDSVTKAKPCNLVNIPSSVLNPKSSKIVVLSILLLAVLGVLAFVIGHITNAPNGLPTSQAVALSTDTIQPSAVASQVSPKDGMELVQIPAGEFLMGANDTDSDEKPQHKVRLDVYWIDKLEVTNGQYAQCVLDGKCEEPKDKTSNTRKVYFGNSAYDNFPVLHVDWHQAQAYCAWAGRRLPTEAEWEKAARGKDGRMYSWGNAEPDCEKANFGDETCVRTKDTTLVGQYPSGVSPYGVLDMSGNVWEWTSTVDKPYPYDAHDGREDIQSSGDRVMRGGSWNTGAWLIRTSARYRNHPDYSSKKLGFRCAQ